MNDLTDAELRARQVEAAAVARARRGAVVVFAGGFRIPAEQAHLMAQAWSNQGTLYEVLGHVLAGEDQLRPGAPPWWPQIIGQPAAPAELDAHLERMEVESRAARDRERVARSGRVAPS